MERRTYLRALGAAGLAGTAGCLGSIAGSESSETVLGPPEDERGSPSHPIHGEEFPPFSLPDPLSGETITAEQFEGERAIVMTFIFTSCPDGACPALVQRLLYGQQEAEERGYSDDVVFLAMTFDPEQDTPEELERYADDFGVDLEVGNWHFLRPETYDEGKELLDDEFGMPIERVDLDEVEEADDEHSDHDESGSSDHGDDHTDHDNDFDHSDHDHDYTFTHFNLILLANENGVVERSYPRATQMSTETILDDLQTVLEG